MIAKESTGVEKGERAAAADDFCENMDALAGAGRAHDRYVKIVRDGAFNA